jgi:hypothetical protein
MMVMGTMSQGSFEANQIGTTASASLLDLSSFKNSEGEAVDKKVFEILSSNGISVENYLQSQIGTIAEQPLKT